MVRQAAKQTGKLGKKRVRLCREGVYYLAVCAFVLLGSILRDVNLLLVVACMMIGPFVLNGLAAAGMLRRLRVTREIPTSVEAGLPWTGTYRIDNEQGRTGAWTLVCRDRIRHAERAESWPVEAYAPYAPYRHPTLAPWSGPPLPRGRHLLGPLSLETRFPFGLVVASAEVPQQDALFVTPQLGHLGANWTAWLQRAERIGGSGGNRNGRSEGEFHSMRDWRSGDPRKWIHWRTTARRNALTVREWEASQTQDLVVLLDLHLAPSANPEPRSTAPSDSTHSQDPVERLISFVATLIVRQCVRSGARVVLGIAGREVALISGAAGYRLQEELLHQLALATPPSQSTLPNLLSQLHGQVPPDAIVLIVSRDTPSPPPGSDPRLIARWIHVPVLTAPFRSIFTLPGDAKADTVASPLVPILPDMVPSLAPGVVSP